MLKPSTMLDGGIRAARPTDPVRTARLVLTPVGAEGVDDLVMLYGGPVRGVDHGRGAALDG